MYPKADISFLIADVKYNKEDGVKICEIQHGISSTFYGDRFSHGEPGLVSTNFIKYLSQYQIWAVSDQFAELQIRKVFEKSPKCHCFKHLMEIAVNPIFERLNSLPIDDPYDVDSYHGIIAGRYIFKNYDEFKKEYPNIILLNEATRPYRKDKYKMSELFAKDKELSSYKPRWGLYPKKYTNLLAGKIIKEIQSDILVIKPRGAFLGNGVIIVKKEDLDSTLKYILNTSDALRRDTDISYRYWPLDKFDSFLVEQFIESSPICVPHLDNRIYQPTMRVAFLLVHTNRKINVEFLGMNWMTPVKALSEEGSLNDKHKAYCKAPYFCKVDTTIKIEVEKQLKTALTLLYKQMLYK